MALEDIQKAILTKFLGLNLGYPIAVENDEFDPSEEAPNGGIWCRFTFSPNDPEVKTLGVAGDDEVTGFAQFDINVPPGTGTSVTFDFYQRLKAFNVFAAGTYLEHNGQQLFITSCGLSQGRRVEEFYRKSVRVFWRSDLTRNP